MAIRAETLLNGNRLYTGLSSDTKPTAGVNATSVFVESNTGRVFAFDGAAWVAPPVSPWVFIETQAGDGTNLRWNTGVDGETQLFYKIEGTIKNASGGGATYTVDLNGGGAVTGIQTRAIGGAIAATSTTTWMTCQTDDTFNFDIELVVQGGEKRVGIFARAVGFDDQNVLASYTWHGSIAAGVIGSVTDILLTGSAADSIADVSSARLYRLTPP